MSTLREELLEEKDILLNFIHVLESDIIVAADSKVLSDEQQQENKSQLLYIKQIEEEVKQIEEGSWINPTVVL